MYRLDGRWVISAGDLVDVVECGHRTALTQAVADGRVNVGVDQAAPGGGGVVPLSPPDRTAVRHGEAHERRWLAHLRRTFGADGVVEIPRPEPTVDGLAGARAHTREALARGVPVVYQGVLFDGGFQGRPDFLIAAHLDPSTGAARGPAVPGHYEPVDAKLARAARPAAVLQLAAYALALPSVAVPVPRLMHLVHPAVHPAVQPGSGASVGLVRSFRVDDFAPLVTHARARLAAHLARPAKLPEPTWAQARPQCASCAFTEHCATGRVQARDLSLVAGLRGQQQRALRGAGITTVEQLAVAPDEQRPVEISTTAFAGLRLQAELQAAQDASRSTEDPVGTVSVRMVDAAGLAMLPQPDPGDIYFDMEGDPYALEASGLEYLFGAVTLTRPPDGTDLPGEEFRTFWAHDRAGERRALEEFVDWTTARLRDHPRAHVYHYAPYEPNALRRLAARHGTRERQVDDLLRAHRLVDLHTVVRRSLRVSQPSYSIKYLEPLFYPGARTAAVTTAADSIVAYETVLEHRAAGETAQAERLLAEIADYNRVDCVSTHRLHRWLLAQRRAAGVPAHLDDPTDQLATGPEAVDPADAQLPGQATLDGDGEPDAVVHALLAGLPADQATWSPDERARALLAAAVGYHRRENKPAWWTYFAALQADRETLESADDCAVPVRWQVSADWDEPSGRRRNARRQLRARVDPRRPHPFERGETVRLLYPGPPGAVGVTSDATVEQAAPDELLLLENAPPDRATRALPMAVLPGEPVSPKPKPAAVHLLAERVAAALPALPAEAGLDLLRRVPPRRRDRIGPLPDAADHGDDQVAAVIAAVSELEASYLAVQGPPGAGKTYLAGRLIRHLVGQGASVGICSTSHKAIENAMHAALDDTDAVIGPDGPPGRGGRRLAAAKKAKRSRSRADGPSAAADAPPWDTPRDLKALVAWRREHPEGHLVGDTAWAFANPQLAADPFDVLIIDEAGQFALADTLAVAGAARNLVLLGDPQQLPQVVAGIHPDGADASALSHLLGRDDDGLGENEVLPAAFGYFLDRTRRLHPAVCAPVSALAYGGRLHAHPVAAARAVHGVVPGLHLVDVAHEGATTRCDAEVDAVCALVAGLVGRTFVDGLRQRPLTPADVLVVAPYNRQVRAIGQALRTAGIAGVRVGTVDRFQGQEAPVVITSLTTSSAAEAPRGLDFLLSRNRLNVALSRAQVMAVLVMSPALLDSAPRSIAELRLLAGLARLRAMSITGAPPPPSAESGPELRPAAGTDPIPATPVRT
ncbi:TM0106 family RecB-like putative nuclease [Frankia sp. R82]|uniref:TM0106 family RecB-like putative nuclease n=1 Tax=Frankia sp. R82 TaxID=2950553 RepID=UPI002044AF71|nr:TM0106 family RecB-like putative nuclease [Frankia sp. R82]MCM3883629.1 TM0106 family RecB-like putative nuclease [Frankia sp. R82]